MLNLTLGILYKDKKIVNHRSLFKVLLNPILRYFGYYIGTVCKEGRLGSYKICKGQKKGRLVWDFNSYNEYDMLVRKRMIF